MKQLIIEPNDFYNVDDRKYFKFDYFGTTIRDVYVDIKQNPKYVLQQIAYVCELKCINNLTKNQLVKLIENSNCLITEL